MSGRAHRGTGVARTSAIAHTDEKRLAVLESVLRDGLSVRAAAQRFAVNKNSVQTWLSEHRRGKRTAEMLRSAGIEPEARQSQTAEDMQSVRRRLQAEERDLQHRLDKVRSTMRALFSQGEQ